jgi:hypothetical protein
MKEEWIKLWHFGPCRNMLILEFRKSLCFRAIPLDLWMELLLDTPQ